MFDKSYFELKVLHKIFHNLFAWTFYHFTCLPLLEGDIVRIINYNHDIYFSDKVDYLMLRLGKSTGIKNKGT